MRIFRSARQHPLTTGTCWTSTISVRLDGDVPAGVIRELIRESYELVVGGLPEKMRKALAAEK